MMKKPVAFPAPKKAKERMADALERIAAAAEAMQRELESSRKFLQSVWSKRP